MLRFFRSRSPQREIHYHEDDYCQQQLLPRAAAEHVELEIRKSNEFADAHRAPSGFGWTDVYAIQDAPVELCSLKITRELLAGAISPFLRPFDIVYTGYSSHREKCRTTAAWGTSERCALFANWKSDGIITNIWTNFFDDDKASILAATESVAALGKYQPLVYVDWAWSYTCDVADKNAFAARLSEKLKAICERVGGGTSSGAQ
jgi:hypothetical protein